MNGAPTLLACRQPALLSPGILATCSDRGLIEIRYVLADGSSHLNQTFELGRHVDLYFCTFTGQEELLALSHGMEGTVCDIVNLVAGTVTQTSSKTRYQ